jgi:hypothetical protein
MPTITDAVRGSAGTAGILAAKRVVNMADKILLLEPSATPLTVFTAKLNKKETFNSDYKDLQDELLPFVTRVNNGGGYTAGALTIVVDDEQVGKVGDIVAFPRTNEVVRISSISATDSSWTVAARSWGSTAAAALLDNDQVAVIGGSNAENATTPTAKVTKAASATNYTQIFRNSFGVSRTLMNSRLYGGDELAYQARKVGIEHRREIELAFWFGEAVASTSAAYAIRTTGGVEEHISTNATNVGGSLTELDLENYLRSAMRYGDQRKLHFCSREQRSAIDLLASGKVEMTSEEKTFGIQVDQIRGGGGMVGLVTVNLFSDADTYKENGYTLDMSQLTYQFLTASDTMLITNVQANNVDGRQDEYLSEVGLMRGHERTMSRLSGVTLT